MRTKIQQTTGRFRCHPLFGLLALLAVGLLGACSAQADVVLDWSAATLDAIRTDRTPPPKAARALAMVHVAMFDAVNAIRGGYEQCLAEDLAACGNESAGVPRGHRR